MLYCYLRSLNKSIKLIPMFHNDKSHGLDDEIILQIEGDSLLIIPDASGSESEEQYNIGELGYNNFMGKQSKQCVISKMECIKHKEKEIDWEKLFK